jgi:hypothetical protein
VKINFSPLAPALARQGARGSGFARVHSPCLIKAPGNFYLGFPALPAL